MFNWLGKEEVPIIRQSTSSECGLACVTMIANYHGHQIDLQSMRMKYEISTLGASLSDLVEIGATLDLSVRGISCDLPDLASITLPAILHWDFKHFVVLKSIKKGLYEIHDPSEGKLFLKGDEVSKHFTGIALEIKKSNDFRPRKEKADLKVTSLVKLDKANWGMMARVLLLSLFLQGFVLVAPLFMQLVIDEAIFKNDISILAAIAFGFLGLKLFELFVSVARQVLLQLLGQMISFDLRGNVFHHLVRLPVSYFQLRGSGDILQRAESGNAIGKFVANNLVEAIVDGVFAISIAIVIFSYSPALGAVVTGFVLLYALARFIFLRISHKRQSEEQITQAKEATYFLETLRIMPTLKMFGGEGIRESKWRNLASDSINKGIRSGNMNIGYSNLSQGIGDISNIAVVFIAAYAVINSDMTVGMITAFMAYKIQFEQKSMSLLDKVLEYKLMDVHLDRLSDIALTPKEDMRGTDLTNEPYRGIIEFKHVYFRYSPLQEDVIKGVSFRVSPQEFVALAGRSGQGKSTILKLIMGIYKPTGGQILYDGKPIDQWGAANLRKHIGIVMQDDELISGSIKENICFFEDNPDLEKIDWAAQVASIFDDIQAMPMGMNTLIGEMGSALSGGQKQRIMLARALYKQPKVLILDEGTSHLDLATESRINDELKKLEITRIFAAHRPDTLSKADRIIRVNDGTVFSESAHDNTVIDESSNYQSLKVS